MAIYRGITYNPADVNEKAPAMKAGIYRGIKWESEKKAAKKASRRQDCCLIFRK